MCIKKFLGIALSISMSLSLTNFVFAAPDDDIEYELNKSLDKNSINFDISVNENESSLDEQSYFELVSPKINTNSNVRKEAELLVSIKFLKNIDATISITNFIEPKSVVFSDENEKKLNKIVKNAPLYVMDDFERKEDLLYDPIVEVSDDTENSSYDDIYTNYNSAGRKLLLAYDNFQSEYARALKNNSIESKDLNNLIKNRLLISNGLNDLHSARQLYEASVIEYMNLKTLYDDYHMNEILSDEPMIIDGVLPFYNFIIDEVKLGRYEIVIRNSETGEVIGDKIDFYVSDDNKIQKDLYDNMNKSLRNGILQY